eukprot:751222-Hanusia_phi.AAC.1
MVTRTRNLRGAGPATGPAALGTVRSVTAGPGTEIGPSVPSPITRPAARRRLAAAAAAAWQCILGWSTNMRVNMGRHNWSNESAWHVAAVGHSARLS